MQDLEHKNLGVSGGIIETTEDGIVEALVSVTGIVDNVDDIIEPGAYEKTLKERRAKGVWSHDWNTPVSRAEEIKELLPGDPSLPERLPNGDPWPAEAGALYVKAKFNLNTQRGRDAFEDVKFYEKDCEWSIGYKVPKGGSSKDDKTGIRRIKQLDLYEFSPVLFGAASNARSLIRSAKNLFESEEDFLTEVKSIVGTTSEEEEDEQVKSSSTAEVVVEPVTLDEDIIASIKTAYDNIGIFLAKVAHKPETKTYEDESFKANIDSKYEVFTKSLSEKNETEIKSSADSVLDEISLALISDNVSPEYKNTLNEILTEISESLKTYDTESVESKSTEEEPKEESKKITISADEWKSLLDFS